MVPFLCVYGCPMVNRKRLQPPAEPRKPEPISIKAARACFGSFVDHVVEGHPALICRRSTPLAVLLPATEYEELIEAVRGDQSLAAILGARGAALDCWTTTGVLEAVVRLLEEGRS